jgi:hypothetical protein
MITQEQLYRISKASPAMLEAFYNAVGAILDYRRDLAELRPGWFTSIRQTRKALKATYLSKRFCDGFVNYIGRKLSEQECKLVKQWIIEAANFHSLSKEQQLAALEKQVAANGGPGIAPEDSCLAEPPKDWVKAMADRAETRAALSAPEPRVICPKSCTNSP